MSSTRPTEVSRYIEEHRGRFGVEPICRILDVSASAYYQRKTDALLQVGEDLQPELRAPSFS